MDPNHDQGRQGDSEDGNNEHRTANVDSTVHRRARSIVGSTARTVGGLLLSDRDSWNSRQTALSGENAPSNDKTDAGLVELTILCAHNLKNLRFLGSTNPRALLYIDKPFTVNTLINFNGGRNPHWNYTFWFKIDDASLQIGHLTIKIYDWSCLGRDRLIGTARMPMSDLIGSNWVKKFFSYQV